MKVLFVYPDIGTRGSARHFSTGIGYLSAVLKEKGHETSLIYWCGQPLQVIKKKIMDFSPQLIAFSSMTTQFRHVLRLGWSLVGETEAVLIGGGSHVTLEPESLKHSPLRAICRGEGEEALPELIDRIKEGKGARAVKNFWWKDNGLIYHNPLRPLFSDLDSLPFPDREIFDYQTIVDSDFGQASFIFSRGCPFNCSYCSNHAFHQLYGEPYVRFRSVDKALAEIEQVASRYHFKTIVFDDDTMTADIDWLKGFLDGYRQSFHYPFDLNIRVETVEENLFRLLKESGCRKVSIGVECGNEKLRKDVLRRRMNDREIIECFNQARLAGLKTKSFNLIGFPGENSLTFRDTIRLNQIINPSSLILNIFYPYPGTDLYELCREKDYLGEERENFRERDDTILNLPDFPRKDILKFYRQFGYLVYLRNHLWKAMVYWLRYSALGEPVLKWMEKALPWGGGYAKRMIKILSRA
jgi:radical SAM superfamily enzyme YgiQ (UPF0313 family)